MAKTNGRTRVADQIISRLKEAHENGDDLSWRKMWKGSHGVVTNAKTNHVFGGGNWINFFFAAMFAGYESSYWATANQWKHLGTNLRTVEVKGKDKVMSDAHVRKGESATYGLVPLNGSRTVIEDGKEVEETFVYFRAYPYFNLEQMENIDVDKLPNRQISEFTPIEAAEEILNAVQGIDLRHGEGTGAYYKPVRHTEKERLLHIEGEEYDYVMMPSPKSFEKEDFYYAVRFHETIHWTGHKDRLDRDGISQVKPFGAEEYSLEELVAEFGSAMLCARTGISNMTLDNSLGYMAHWLEVLENDSSMLLKAAGLAQKAVDYILAGGQKEEKEQSKSIAGRPVHLICSKCKTHYYILSSEVEHDVDLCEQCKN